MKKPIITMIGLCLVALVSTGAGSIVNRASPVWYATEALKSKGFGDALFPEQGVDLKAMNDKQQPVWTKHRDWPDGTFNGLPATDLRFSG